MFVKISLPGKTTFIHYVANYLANKQSFHDRLSQAAVELTEQETVWSLPSSGKKYAINRYSFPIDNQTILTFLDCPLHIVVDSENRADFMKPPIDHFEAVIMIMDGTVIQQNLDWNNFKQSNLLELFEGSEKLLRLFEHLSFVFPNCSSHQMDIDRPAHHTWNNINFYFMQNSAYQLYRAPSITDSVETDYHKSMETMGRIIEKIVDRIRYQKNIETNCKVTVF